MMLNVKKEKKKKYFPKKSCLGIVRILSNFLPPPRTRMSRNIAVAKPSHRVPGTPPPKKPPKQLSIKFRETMKSKVAHE